MKQSKKLISITLSLLMIVSVVCLSVFSSSAVTTITEGDYSFAINGDGTYSLYSYNGSATDLVLPETVIGRPVVAIYDNCFSETGVTSVVIPDSYSSIGSSAFYGCTALKSIAIPAGITSIGSLAFNSCTALEQVGLSAASKLTTLPFAAFQGDTALKSITIPSNITTIASNAFCNTGLTSVVIPDSVTSLGSNVFSGCADLASVVLSQNITTVPSYAFSDCTSLSEISVPVGVTTIDNRAFYGCTSLTSVELPLTLTTLGARVFTNAESLTCVYIPDSVTSIGADCFYPMSVQGTLNIECVEGTYAYTFCYDNYVTTVTVLKGDFNLDNVVDVRDVTAVQKYLVGLEQASAKSVSLCESTGDGKLDVRDVTRLQKFISKSIASLL